MPGRQGLIGLLECWEEPVEEKAKVTAEAIAEAIDVPAEDTALDVLTISLPLAGHTASSLRNLVTMIYSRGPLLSKATGGHFACPLEQVDSLKDCITVFDAISRITDALVGLTITTDKITFTFPATDDADNVKTFTQLAAQMNKSAKAQKRVMAKLTDVSNEKYIFRIWLLALGMGGEEFKTARRMLLHPLTGSAAFKDQAMEDRWKEKQAAKRDALRKAKEVSADEMSE